MDWIAQLFGDVRNVVPPPWSEMFVVAVSILCGAVVGAERERHEKPAGLRTLMLICVGSTVFTLASISSPLSGGEPGRIAAQIVTGVGFLGAGAILRDAQGITGLTTAASVWATAGVGIVAGAGYALPAIGLSFTIVATLAVVRGVETKLSGPCRAAQIRIRFRDGDGKTQIRIQRVVDVARGPVQCGRPVSIGDDRFETTITHCETHREHRAVLAALAEVPYVEDLRVKETHP